MIRGRPKRLLLIICLGIFVAIQVVVAIKARPYVPFLGAYLYDQAAPFDGPIEPVATADLTGSGPGSVVTATTMPFLSRNWEARGLEAARVVYRSTSGDDGRPTLVSGSVFVPKGKAPAGGWPVVSMGHGTLGVDISCGPSLSQNLFGALMYVQELTSLGYAVAYADFQGLGMKGIHPYTDSRTAGLNMIDAVRALRKTFPDVSDRWVAVGHSQGGGAAWAANEQAGRYAPELRMIGALAASPGADLSGLVEKAEAGTLTRPQRTLLLAIIETLARLHPDLDRDDFRNSAAVSYWNAPSECTADAAYRRATVLGQIGPRDFTPKTPEAADRLQELLSQWALPQQPLTAPLYVWYGGEDPFIDAAWTKEAVARSCAMGGVITIVFAPERGHLPPDVDELVKWVGDRFEGRPPVNDC